MISCFEKRRINIANISNVLLKLAFWAQSWNTVEKVPTLAQHYGNMKSNSDGTLVKCVLAGSGIQPSNLSSADEAEGSQTPQ